MKYDVVYERMLEQVASAQAVPIAPVTPFWPLIGWKYDGSLMVVGRSVNGWIDDWPIGDLEEPVARAAIIREMRADAERSDRCRMLWVTDAAGRGGNYNTRRSAFWRVLHELALHYTGAAEEDWPSNLAWTNLFKVAPAAGWNPGADLQRAQRDAAAALLRIEIETLQPRRLLALTGRWWIGSFLETLGAEVTWREGLVEGVGRHGDTALVIAKHPMTKPHSAFVQEVRAAFG
jgi:hypothetical protein